MNQRLLRLGAAALALMAVACGTSPASTALVLPAADVADSGVPFRPNEVVPGAAFSDFPAMTAAAVESFLANDPYSGTSFLETYESNGIPFSEAVVRAATTYRINPIVLLVAVEAVGGLVADGVYPQTSVPVEYLFGCGCSVPSDLTTCAVSTAGLDVQLACYASALRTSLDEIAVSGETAGGWGPGVPSVSLDGVTVTPEDNSTAALYQYDPVVGTGHTGMSLFANIWVEYARALSYATPASAAQGATSLVGDACLSAVDCAFTGALCATGAGYPGGMCTEKCSGSCAGVDAFCADFTAGGYCLAVCNPTDPASCRAGYSCTLVMPSGAPAGTAAENVCTPG